MASFTDVFARKEMKYRLDAQQYGELLSLIQIELQPSEYAEGQVTSLYYDTPYFELIERSLEKPLYKEKLRVRVYGTTFEDKTPAFIELKKKFKGVVYKRRIEVSLAAAQAFLQGEDYERACQEHPLANEADHARSLDTRSLQIAHEISCFLDRHEGLIPAVFISCDRQSFEQRKDRGSESKAQELESATCTHDLRITFDTNLRAVPYPASLKEADEFLNEKGTPIISPDEALMEVKCTGALPFWLVDALNRTCSYKRSFSKYGTAYMQMLRKGA